MVPHYPPQRRVGKATLNGWGARSGRSAQFARPNRRGLIVRSVAFLLAVFATAGSAALPAAAANPSGTAIAVVQSSEADGDTGRRLLSPQGPLYSRDRVITGRIGEAQLQFRDGTKLVVGANSSIVLDAFVINADNSARQVSIDVVKGAMRFITGSGPKDAYSISTPTATISVRGTAFDLEVEPAGT